MKLGSPAKRLHSKSEGVYEGGSGRVGGSTARGKAWMKLISPATTLHNTTEGVNEIGSDACTREGGTRGIGHA